METDTLLARCRLGDDLAWEGLVRRYQGRVFGLALHFLRDRDEARDAAQEVFLKVYRHLDRLDEGRAFLPWLLRLTRNACLDRLRRLKVRRPEEGLVPVDEATELPAPDRSAEEELLADDRRALLYRAMGGLSERSREVIVLKDIEEMTLQEISELLGVTLGTVKSRSHRARLELARAVRELDPSYGV